MLNFHACSKQFQIYNFHEAWVMNMDGIPMSLTKNLGRLEVGFYLNEAENHSKDKNNDRCMCRTQSEMTQ